MTHCSDDFRENRTRPTVVGVEKSLDTDRLHDKITGPDETERVTLYVYNIFYTIYIYIYTRIRIF